MTVHETSQVAWPRSAVLEVGEDTGSTHSGAPSRGSVAETTDGCSIAEASPKPWLGPRTLGDRVADSRVAVVVLLFAVLGPFALPWLWRSRKFSRPWKVALTILVLILTVVIAWDLWREVNRLRESLRELQEAGVF